MFQRLAHFYLLFSPCALIPSGMYALEDALDSYIAEKHIPSKWRRVINPPEVLSVGCVRITRDGEEVSIQDTAKKFTEFVPIVRYRYWVEGRAFVSRHAFYKRPRFSTYKKCRSYLVNTLSENVPLSCLYSQKNPTLARLAPTKEMLPLGYDRNLRARTKHFLLLGGAVSGFAVAYSVGSDVAKTVTRRFLGYGLAVNVVLVTLLMYSKYKSEFFRLKGCLEEECEVEGTVTSIVEVDDIDTDMDRVKGENL